MFTLKARMFGHDYQVEAETESEILSLAVAGFDQSAELISISENDEVKYVTCEIYAIIKRCAY